MVDGSIADARLDARRLAICTSTPALIRSYCQFVDIICDRSTSCIVALKIYYYKYNRVVESTIGRDFNKYYAALVRFDTTISAFATNVLDM